VKVKSFKGVLGWNHVIRCICSIHLDWTISCRCQRFL